MSTPAASPCPTCSGTGAHPARSPRPYMLALGLWVHVACGECGGSGEAKAKEQTQTEGEGK